MVKEGSFHINAKLVKEELKGYCYLIFSYFDPYIARRDYSRF